MDATQKACCEALNFFFQTEFDLSTEGKKVLILQGSPASYTKFLKQAEVDVITYHAGANQAWKKQDVTTSQDINTEKSYDLIIQFATKSEQETLLHLAIAKQYLAAEGAFIGVVHNKMGAGRFKREVENEFPGATSVSKSKSRVFFSQNTVKQPNSDSLNPTQLNQPKQVADSEYLTLPGVYGEKALDKGSQILAKYLRDECWSGIGADIGCGYGYLTGELLTTRHRVKQLWLYDIDSRAIQMAKHNLKLKGHDSIKIFPHWVNICESIPVDRPVHWAVMNPPFHSGISQDYALGKTFIKQAASILREGAPLFMVANVHLPYEETLHENFRSVVHLGTEDGFKCYRATK